MALMWLWFSIKNVELNDKILNLVVYANRDATSVDLTCDFCYMT